MHISFGSGNRREGRIIENTFEYLPEISFIDNITLDDLRKEFISDYEEELTRIYGKEKSLPQVCEMRALINASVINNYQALMYLDNAGKMQLVKYSKGSYLDYLGAFVNVKREEEKAATVKMKFLVSQSREHAIAIPAGTQVTNGSFYFETKEYEEIAPGTKHKEITMYCTTAGIQGNGIPPGEINTLVTSIPYISEVSNITESSGAQMAEDDESYAKKTYLAPSGTATTGTEDSYELATRMYTTDIANVKVYSPGPGEVEVKYIKKNGDIPNDEELEGLKEYLYDRKKKVLTDYITVSGPEPYHYEIDVDYCINVNQAIMASTIQENVNKSIEEYIEWQSGVIGRDIDPSYLICLMRLAGAIKININKPHYYKVDEQTITKNIGIKTNYKGLDDD